MAKDSKDSSDLEYEIRFYENLLNRKPDFLEALAALADLYTKAGNYEKGLELDQKLARFRPDDPVVYYNLACSHSLMNNVDDAYASIKRAVRCGYADFRHIEFDKDLTNLKKDSRFKRYLARVKRLATKAQ